MVPGIEAGILSALSSFCMVDQHKGFPGSPYYICGVDDALCATNRHILVKIELCQSSQSRGLSWFKSDLIFPLDRSFSDPVTRDRLTVSKANKLGHLGKDRERVFYDAGSRTSREKHAIPDFDNLIPADNFPIHWTVLGQDLKDLAGYVRYLQDSEPSTDETPQGVAVGFDDRCQRLFISPSWNPTTWMSVQAVFSNYHPPHPVDLVLRLDCSYLTKVLDLALSVSAKSIRFSHASPEHWENPDGDELGVKGKIRFDVELNYSDAWWTEAVDSIFGVIMPIAHASEGNSLERWQKFTNEYSSATSGSY